MGEEITISYDSLFDLTRREKSREELQKIEDSFYGDVASFLKDQERGLMGLSHGMEYEKAKIQITNVKKLLKELYEKRERKILNLVLYKVKSGTSLVDMTPLLPEEQVFFEKAYQLLMQGRESIIEPVLAGRNASMDILVNALTPKQENAGLPENSTLASAAAGENSAASSAGVLTGAGVGGNAVQEPRISVKLLMPLPEFLGRDLEIYGPFKEGDVAQISETVAKVLVEKNAAQFFE